MIKSLKIYFQFICVFILTLISFEIFFQISEIFLPSMVTNDNSLGRTLKPNARINLVKESFYIGRVNSLGYLGPTYSKFKEDNVIRIALIGDSFVEGFQVFNHCHFRTILEKKLNKLCNYKIEVLNFGRSGQDLRDMYIMNKLYSKQYNIDIVIFFLQTGDLFLNKNKAIGPDLILKNDSLFIDSSFQKLNTFKFLKKYDFIRNFSFYSFLQSAYNNINSGNIYQTLFDKLYLIFNNYNKTSIKPKKQKNNNKILDINYNIVDNLSKEQLNYNKYIFVPITSVPTCFNEYLLKKNMKVLCLDSIYLDLKKRGINPFYWKSSNIEGHWNYEAHKEIGIFLANNIVNIINNKNLKQNN